MIQCTVCKPALMRPWKLDVTEPCQGLGHYNIVAPWFVYGTVQYLMHFLASLLGIQEVQYRFRNVVETPRLHFPTSYFVPFENSSYRSVKTYIAFEVNFYGFFNAMMIHSRTFSIYRARLPFIYLSTIFFLPRYKSYLFKANSSRLDDNINRGRLMSHATKNHSY